MTTRLLTAILFLTTIGCNRNTNNKVDCSPYFIFDQVEHFSTSISEDSVFRLIELDTLTFDQSKLLGLLMNNKPDTIPDTTSFLDIEKFGFTKKEIQKDKLGQLNSIFCERKHDNAIYTLCAAVYRDILIFKRQGKTIGFARVCFDCGDSIIAGTDKDWSEFGQSGDFQRLGAILEN